MTQIHQILLRSITLGALVLGGLPCTAQDTTYAREVISRLCSDKFHGRGYYKNGAVKSSAFIAAEMKKNGLKPLGQNFYQTYGFPVNTISKDPVLSINDWVPVPGKDFIVNAATPSSQIITNPNSSKEVVWIHAQNIRDSVFRRSIVLKAVLHYKYKTATAAEAPVVFLIDTLPADLEKKYASFLAEVRGSTNSITFRKDKLTWSASPEQSKVVAIEALLRPQVQALRQGNVSVTWEISSKLVQTTQRNVIGYIPGKSRSDSFILVTAHYDHLGRMGKSSIFRGANDNAAGVAMLLDMAAYYRQHPPQFNMVFIAFSGEEAGLIGSSYYVNHPLHTMKKTRFVLNCDLVGTGETGITVVNATIFKSEFALLDSINKANQYLSAVNKRGKAANSDHYFFTELGIPSFFIYQGGPRRSYHDIDDNPETLTLFGYVNTFLLAVDFFGALGNN